MKTRRTRDRPKQLRMDFSLLESGQQKFDLDTLCGAWYNPYEDSKREEHKKMKKFTAEEIREWLIKGEDPAEQTDDDRAIYSVCVTEDGALVPWAHYDGDGYTASVLVPIPEDVTDLAEWEVEVFQRSKDFDTVCSELAEQINDQIDE